MDDRPEVWYFSDMNAPHLATDRIPTWQLYGESRAFPDVLHCERITDRAAGLDWRIAPHRHLHLHQFFLIRAGSATITLEGQILSPTPPFILSVPRNAVHGFVFAAGTDGFVVTIPLQNLPDLFDATSPLTRPAVIVAKPDLVAAFERVHREHDDRLPARAVMLSALATELGCGVLRQLPKNSADKTTAADPRVHQFETLVQEHFRANWQIEDYASELGLSARHLGRICQTALGQSAAAFICATRMREACRLLVYTRASVASIGYQLGFDDPSYFTRSFRRHVGATPGAYRARFEAD